MACLRSLPPTSVTESSSGSSAAVSPPSWLSQMQAELGCCSACVVTYHMFRLAAEETEVIEPPHTRSERYCAWAEWDRQRLLPSLGLTLVPDADGGLGADAQIVVYGEFAEGGAGEIVSRGTLAALDEAGVTLDDLAAVAVTARPGLIGSLLVGVSAAKAS